MTVSFRCVINFDTLPKEEAEKIIYEELLPLCEKKSVKLSQYGNCNAIGSLMSTADYDQKKVCKQLFDVARVQRAFSGLDAIVAPIRRYSIGSYGLKHKIEKLEGKYLSNGDCIVAMLFKGYAANFVQPGRPLNVNCRFKAKVIV